MKQPGPVFFRIMFLFLILEISDRDRPKTRKIHSIITTSIDFTAALRVEMGPKFPDPARALKSKPGPGPPEDPKFIIFPWSPL